MEKLRMQRLAFQKWEKERLMRWSQRESDRNRERKLKEEAFKM